MSRWPLHQKARLGDESGLRHLLVTDVHDINTWNWQHKTPLLSADYTKPEIVNLLLQRGAEVHVQDQQLQSPLHLAVAAGNIESVLLIINAGVDLNLLDKDRQTALCRAAIRGMPAIAELLLKKGADVNKLKAHKSILNIVAKAGDERMVKLLLSYGADTAIGDRDGYTPLHFAVEKSRLDLVKLLLEHGADCNKSAYSKSTPLMLALESYELSMIRAFLNRGGNLGVRSYGGETALHYAARNKSHLEVLEFVLDQLLAAGFNVDERDSMGLTPLHNAVRSNNTKGYVCLLRHGADVNARSRWNGTPLSIAMKHDHSEIFEQLLKLGSRVDDSFLEEVLLKNGRYYYMPFSECILLRHIAKLKCLGMGISEETRRIIDEHERPMIYFETCVTELEKMKKRKIYEDVSLADLETKSDAVIAGYARNEELVQNFEDSKKDFPIFTKLAAKRFDMEVKRQRQLRKATATLSEILRFNAEVSRMIIAYLNEDDLKLF